jgi:hypothetical protein
MLLISYHPNPLLRDREHRRNGYWESNRHPRRQSYQWHFPCSGEHRFTPLYKEIEKGSPVVDGLNRLLLNEIGLIFKTHVNWFYLARRLLLPSARGEMELLTDFHIPRAW